MFLILQNLCQCLYERSLSSTLNAIEPNEERRSRLLTLVFMKMGDNEGYAMKRFIINYLRFGTRILLNCEVCHCWLAFAHLGKACMSPQGTKLRPSVMLRISNFGPTVTEPTCRYINGCQLQARYILFPDITGHNRLFRLHHESGCRTPLSGLRS